MTIEVKQLIIKSTVINERPGQHNPEHTAIKLEQLKEMLMEECREMIAENLNEMRER